MAIKQLTVFIQNKKGTVVEVTDILSKNNINLRKANINVEYLYAFMARTERHAYVVLRVEDNERAESVLKKAGIKMISEADINKL